MATAGIFNTLHELETLYVDSSWHFEIATIVLRHFRQLRRIYDIINVGFVCNFAGFLPQQVSKLFT